MEERIFHLEVKPLKHGENAASALPSLAAPLFSLPSYLFPLMAKFYEAITPKLQAFIEEQHLFFVATAPLRADGHVNLSPKGLDVFRILSPNRVGYADLTGSGNETASHVTENGRVTFMFCSFLGPPMFLRLYGTG